MTPVSMMVNLLIRLIPKMWQIISRKQSFQSLKFILFLKLEENSENFCSDVLSSGEDSSSAQGRECLSV
jgi:hypothetical protein